MLADPTPPAVAFNATTADATTGIGLTASVTLSIAGHPFTLTGSYADGHVVVEYHVDFGTAINLGTLDDVVGDIATAFNFTAMKDEFEQAKTAIRGVPVLGDIANVLESAAIRITDLTINTKTKTYGAAIALDFNPPPTPGGTPTKPPQFLGITLLSFGFGVTSVNTSQPTS